MFRRSQPTLVIQRVRQLAMDPSALKQRGRPSYLYLGLRNESGMKRETPEMRRGRTRNTIPRVVTDPCGLI